MNVRDLRITRAVLESPVSGTIELNGDWTGRELPKLSLVERPHQFDELRQLPEHEYAFAAGFFVNPENLLTFVFDPAAFPDLNWRETPVFVAGSFNGWQEAAGRDEWRLRPGELDGRSVLTWSRSADGLLTEAAQQFKFVTGEHHWFEVPHTAPNAVMDETHNRNRALGPHQTGRHRFAFRLAAPLDLSLEHAVVLSAGGRKHAADLQPGQFFFELRTDLPLGAIIADGATTFRLFAPRAQTVKVAYFDTWPAPEKIAWRDLRRRADGSWEFVVREDLHGWFYWYRVSGPAGPFSGFDAEANILDPWARAAVQRDGPGIVLDLARLATSREYFRAPQWQDLIIVEAHLRDLLATSPIVVDPLDRRTFSGLVPWVEHRNCYLKKLGANAIELQPVQENDAASHDEYHWGYMTVNYFAPASSYGREPARASQVVELQEVVEAFHRQGIAVILDVVYNHVGEPNHLRRIDKLYYLETNGRRITDQLERVRQ